MRDIVMGKGTSKSAKKTPKAFYRSTEAEKKNILELYARLAGRERYTNREEENEFADTRRESVEVGDLIAELHSESPEIIIDALKKIEKFSEVESGAVINTLPLVLELLLTNSEEGVRYEAARAIGKIRDDVSVEGLLHTIYNDPSEKVKEAAVKALGHLKAESCLNRLTEILNDVWNQSIRVRRAAAFSLGRLGPKTTISILCDCLTNDPDCDVRREAAESIAICLLKLEKGEAAAVAQAILTQLNSGTEPEPEVRISVINAITVAESISCIDGLISALKKDPNQRVRGQAAHALAHFFDPRIERALIESLDKEEDGVRKRIALSLAHYAMKNPLSLHDDMCDALIHIQQIFPRGSYIWKEAVKALPAC